MKNIVEDLIYIMRSENEDKSNSAITYLGLLVERHIQDRYCDIDYLHLFHNDIQIYNLKLSENDVNSILETVLFELFLYVNKNPVSLAWCLGKFHDKDILSDFLKLFEIYKNDDDVFLQLLFSLNSIYDLREIMNTLNLELKKIDLSKLEKSKEYLIELSSIFQNLKPFYSDTPGGADFQSVPTT
ncbi:hypothetical protein [Flavobacterium stagni]|uniref:Uncharacterized protein n=1 Tax=Flavobacterium stagni TaxID=2506421 RepID=A0A4Q1K6A3_9FLAO|nr:hypothetical protein [Flavobacterium stagni]RXR21475.1 hypothetical protein EQG61_12180 [Flavobacterium stagni]